VIEQEIKLPFANADDARRAVVATGARLTTPRRLLDDQLFDSADGGLRASGCALRVRRDSAGGALTFKGAVRPGPVKSREEIETTIGDASVAVAIVAALGFVAVFRGQKYREEYVLGSAHVMIDEAPMGTFIEIEGTPDTIAHVASLLGRGPTDYRLESYPALWRTHCALSGGNPAAMVFP
jgi:adenylate cyclase, class 2